MFGFLKRKKKKNKDEDKLKESLNKALSKADKEKNLKSTLNVELEKEKKRKKKPKGPNWPAFVSLLLCFVIGLFFFVYGRVQRMGIQGLVPDFSLPKIDTNFQENTEATPAEEKRKLPTNTDGLIIFEKKKH